MPLTLPARQRYYVTPPRAFGQGAGEVFTVAVSTTASAVDLRTIGATVGNFSTAAGTAQNEGRIGAVGNYVLIFADAIDVGFITGPTYASVTGANAPNLATVGTLAGNGVYTNAAGTCAHMPQNTFYAGLIPVVGQDLFLGFVGGGAGKIRLYQYSHPQS